MASETIDYWLNTLPEPYRTRALRGRAKAPVCSPEITEENVVTALEDGFYWRATEEGHGFWSPVYAKLKVGTPLPPPVSFPAPWPHKKNT